MTALLQPPCWPEDPGHRDAIDTLLTMAVAEDRWGETRRALKLLDDVEQIVGTLPASYQAIRRRCLAGVSGPLHG